MMPGASRTATAWPRTLVLAALIICVCAAAGADTLDTVPAGADTQGWTASDAAAGSSGDVEGVPDVDELLHRFDDLYDSSGSFAEMEIDIIKPSKKRTLRLRAWSKGEDKSLLIIDSPARDAGTATLKVDRNLWNYLPKISRTIRIPPSMMMGSWMGSDLTNDDLVRESSYEDDYDSEYGGISDDPAGWRVNLIARPDAVGLWERVEMVFSMETGLPVEAKYYDRKGRHSRTMVFHDVRILGGRLVPAAMTIFPEGEEGKRTEMRYLKAEFDLDLSDSMFSLSELEKVH